MWVLCFSDSVSFLHLQLISADKGILDIDDFSTQEDIEKRQQLLQIAEEKKRMYVFCCMNFTY